MIDRLSVNRIVSKFNAQLADVATAHLSPADPCHRHKYSVDEFCAIALRVAVGEAGNTRGTGEGRQYSLRRRKDVGWAV